MDYCRTHVLIFEWVEDCGKQSFGSKLDIYFSIGFRPLSDPPDEIFLIWPCSYEFGYYGMIFHVLYFLFEASQANFVLGYLCIFGEAGVGGFLTWLSWFSFLNIARTFTFVEQVFLCHMARLLLFFQSHCCLLLVGLDAYARWGGLAELCCYFLVWRGVILLQGGGHGHQDLVVIAWLRLSFRGSEGRLLG